jgi:DNA-binding NtrC family response regulator
VKSEARILVVGRDEMLLQTRKLILGTYFQVQTAGRVSHAVGIMQAQAFDLVVLCYSLTDEESGKIIAMVEKMQPRPQVLAMSALGRAAAGAGAYAELKADDGPFALAKKTAEMLGVELKGAGRGGVAGARRAAALKADAQ